MNKLEREVWIKESIVSVSGTGVNSVPISNAVRSFYHSFSFSVLHSFMVLEMNVNQFVIKSFS